MLNIYFNKFKIKLGKGNEDKIKHPHFLCTIQITKKSNEKNNNTESDDFTINSLTEEKKGG